MDRRTSTTQAIVAGNPATDCGPGADACHAAAPQEGPPLRLGAVFVQTLRHFFPNFNDWLQALPDRRLQPACTYPTRFLAWWGIALYLFQLASRRQLNFKLDSRGTQVLTNLNRLAGTEQTTRPVHNTLNYFVGRVPCDAFAQLRTRMIRHLNRSRVLDPARVLSYLPVALDATGLYSFRQRHCPHCLTSRHGECTIYSHNVLEAKLLGPADLVLSLASEFIDNRDALESAATSEAAFKQDCELKAFSRLAPKLGQAFPQLRLCLTVDALYACGRFFAACQEQGWAFIVTFKPHDLSAVWDEFQTLLPLAPQQRLERELPNGVRQVYRWIRDLSYTDSDGRLWRFHAVQCQESRDGETSTFAWLTDLDVKAQTVEIIANQGGRARWKIENQGFNRQKNSDLNLHHLYSTRPEKLQAYYYLMQIACILLQLLEQGSLLRRLAGDFNTTPHKLFGSLKNIAWLLLESLRCQVWPDECFTLADHQRISFSAFNTS